MTTELIKQMQERCAVNGENEDTLLMCWAIEKLRAQEARIAALTKDAEPVAWNIYSKNGEELLFLQQDKGAAQRLQDKGHVVIPCYEGNPPAPELKPLSLDEIHQRYKNLRGNEPPHYIDIYRDAEAALGILRGGL